MFPIDRLLNGILVAVPSPSTNGLTQPHVCL